MSYRIRLSLTLLLAVVAATGWIFWMQPEATVSLADRETTVFQEENGQFSRAKVGGNAFYVPGEVRPQAPSAPGSSPRVVQWGAVMAADDY